MPVATLLFIGIVVLLALAAILVVPRLAKPAPPLAPGAIDCQADQGCFLDRARYCGLAQGTAIIAGMTVKDEILANCTFRKTIVEVPATEPEEFRILLEGKAMACPYDKYAFDPRLAYNLTLGIEGCRGPLKDAITAYLAARASPG